MSTAIHDPMLPTTFGVSKVQKETYDTFTLELQPKNGKRKFAFSPGQFNMLYVFGVGEIPISISGDPNESQTLVHTTRAVGTVTNAMRELREGAMLGVRGPFGSQWPVKEARGRDIVIVAGGIGLAPLRPAMYEVLGQREEFGNVVLLYGARTPEDILYKREVKRWRSHFDLNVHVTVDRATGAWHGNVGVVTKLIPKAPFDPYQTVALVCGPEIMMRFTVAELKKRGVPEENIFVSMERNMKCAIGFCGHCQFGPNFVCKDGPVFSFAQVKNWLEIREV
ncbi:Ni/Fe hydrogenase subunit gamma [candidate division KSB1 bacterium]|nr:Ni/Fe hydrogenase subunit gamma [candidate division KSB1 bacterium]NIR72787.1 Ni/Fe hydrogenase subunit gamma [candidate division KSB1 bacterium]NIS23743.1 Ni/Fe hydrogenase subunit gamma [candidate division KSB1 bacterium]NIT70664.1 Ni/Fe hydrogenase subunit gamma [candidate division KSB1 bacterium]NIU24391.1 Ni/Fe hydrogenase subunit gamma [candidate division KSB1 bacterium]